MESERIPCARCNALILQATAAATRGLCGRCRRDDQDAELRRKAERATGDWHCNVPYMLRLNKTSEYRLMVLRAAEAAAIAFAEAGFSKADLVSRYGEDPEGFYLDSNDLTAQGNAFARTAFRTWLENTDRWKWTEVQPLEKYLTSLRKKIASFKGS